MDISEINIAMDEQIERRIAVGDSATLALVLGIKDEHRRLLEGAFNASIVARDNVIHIRGRHPDAERVAELLRHMVAIVESGGTITQSDLRYLIQTALSGEPIDSHKVADYIVITPRGQKIAPKTKGQREYVEAVQKNDLVFAIGPAGTGKTYLAMAMAIAALQRHQVSRLILARPAVEAGEKLGYLPGNIEEKVDPYLRPLYDALYDILGMQKCQSYLERRIIEVIPLAYMRGRTFNDSFIVLDEAQNATVLQMKMFLTRMGYGSKAIVTGDITQIDLPQGIPSGLVTVQEILGDVSGVAFVYLTDKDIVRHPLVQRVVLAFEAWEQRQKGATNRGGSAKRMVKGRKAEKEHDAEEIEVGEEGGSAESGDVAR